MRKNNKTALRVLSTATFLAMVSSIATAAFADTYDLNKGSVTVETKDDGYTYVTQEDTETGGYAQNSKGDTLNGTYKDTDPNGVTITSNGEKTENTSPIATIRKIRLRLSTIKLANLYIKPSFWFFAFWLIRHTPVVLLLKNSIQFSTKPHPLAICKPPKLTKQNRRRYTQKSPKS